MWAGKPTVDARSLPAMLWQLLTQDEGDSLPYCCFGCHRCTAGQHGMDGAARCDPAQVHQPDRDLHPAADSGADLRGVFFASPLFIERV